MSERPFCGYDDYVGTHCYCWHHGEMPCCDCGNNQERRRENVECIWPLGERSDD